MKMKMHIGIAIAAAMLVAGCGGASKTLTPDKARIIDVSAVNAVARVQAYEAENGDKSWSDDTLAYLKKCIEPQFPEGTRASWGRGQAGAKMGFLFYFIKPGIPEGTQISVDRDTLYNVQVDAGPNSLVVSDQGDPTVPGVAAAKAFGESLPGQFARPLSVRQDC